MDREAEPRRDLAPSSTPNPMGGETFTIIEKRIFTGPSGKRVELIESMRRNVPFGLDR